MTRKINFGKIAFYGKRKINDVDVEIRLTENTSGNLVFTASAYVWNSKRTDIVIGGQCFDELKPYLIGNELFTKVVELWKRNHLNDMNPGTPEQMKVVNEYRKGKKHYTYDDVVEHLKSIGLYEVTLEDGSSYRYGSAWLYRNISDEDLQEIKGLFEMSGEKNDKS